MIHYYNEAVILEGDVIARELSTERMISWSVAKAQAR